MMAAAAAIAFGCERTVEATSAEQVDSSLLENIESLVLSSAPGNPRDREAFALLSEYGLIRFMRQARMLGIDTGALRIALAGCILERSVAQSAPQIERMQAFIAVQLFYWGYVDRQEPGN